MPCIDNGDCQRLLWAVTEGLTATALLVAGGKVYNKTLIWMKLRRMPNHQCRYSTCCTRWHWEHFRRCQLPLDLSTPSSCALLVRSKSQEISWHREWLTFPRPCGLPFKLNVETLTQEGQPSTSMSLILFSRGLIVTSPSVEFIHSFSPFCNMSLKLLILTITNFLPLSALPFWLCKTRAGSISSAAGHLMGFLKVTFCRLQLDKTSPWAH